MVTFTCQNCNSSLKKNQVEKHYQFKCHRAKYLTCIDCLKDFMGEDYVQHTSCITENQKYGGKDYVQKPQGVKQNAWVEVCQRALNRDDLNGNKKQLLTICSEHNNIPRNRKKFHNFVSNVAKAFKSKTTLIDEVFDIIAEEWKKTKEAETKDQNKSKNDSDEDKPDNENPSEQTDKKRKRVDSDSPTVPPKKKDKKKKKRLEMTDSQIGEIFQNAVMVGLGQAEPKRTLSESGEEKPAEVPNLDKLSKKEKKKLKKEMKYNAEIKEIESAPKSDEVDGTIQAEPEGKKKKHKKKSKEEPAPVSNGVHEEPSETPAAEDEIVEPTGKFDWSSTILQILQASKDKEMSLKKLSKKVLSEYQYQKGDREPFEKLSAKFNKKVVKTPGVRVLKDRAELID